MRMTAWNAFLALVLAACLAAPALVQGQPADPNAAQPAEPARLTEPAPAPPQPLLPLPQPTAGPELLKRMKTRISVDLREAPIEDVIKSLAEQADIDIVKGPRVTGTVTAKLTDVPLDEAMESIFTVHGYGYTTSESIVRIVPKSELAQFMIKYETKTYHIAYADIDELNKTLTGMLTPQGKMAMNKETRRLWITDTEDQIKKLDAFIEEVDRETPQILVEARIYDVSCSDSLDLGFQWFAGTRTLYDPTTGLPLYDPVSSETDPFTSGEFSSGISQAAKGTFGLRFGVLNNDVDLDTSFTAVKDNVKARLLANPKILVLNGQEANIKIVSEIPYQELTQTSGGGNMGTTSFKDVGVELTVTPEVTRDDKIRLLLNPVFSVEKGSVPITIPTTGQSIESAQPIVDKREALTLALIKDGETVVIGGLRKKDVVREISKVPLLSDIPVLGELFKFRGEKTVNSELIVFITPRVIKTPELSDKDTRKLEFSEMELCEPQGPEPTGECCGQQP